MSRGGIRLFVLSAWMVLCLGAACRSHPASDKGFLDLQAGNRHIRAELASTPIARSAGLMFRTQMDENTGMLFVFPDDTPRAFWMKNTLLPLSIAFMDDHGVILNVEDMEPQTEDPHPSRGPAKFALEMNQGWFDRAGVGAGVTIKGVEMASTSE